MAVEARHLNLFPPQLIGNREIMNPIQGNAVTGMYNNSQIGYGVMPLSSSGGVGVATEALLPTYNSVITDSMPPKTTTATAAMKSDSGLTYNVPISLPRKRSRDSINPSFSYPTPPTYKNCNNNPFSFLGEDISLHLQQQQFDIDRLISQHMEKVRLEIEEKRKRQARRIIEAIEVGMVKRVRAKEEEIEKIGKLNWALEERVKTLCVENQIWRDLAQTNEATANALRTNLEQVLAHQVKDDGRRDDDCVAAANALMDDAQSCCGSSGGDEGQYDDVAVGLGGWRTVKGTSGEEGTSGRCSRNGSGLSSTSRWCRNCGKEEACVLLLPCRHLCLCTVCGSSLHTCPICKSTKNASVHVNMS